jgi:hypothetical protein
MRDKGIGGGPHGMRRNDWVEVVQLGEDALVALVKEGIDGLLDDADGVVRAPVQVSPNLREDVFGHVVEGVVGQHICTTWTII